MCLSSIIAMKLKCEFKIFPTIVLNKLYNTYSCQVMSIDFSDHMTIVTGFSGTHMAGKTIDNLKLVSFEDPSYALKIIPQNLANIFPNLTHLRFLSCPIETLNGDELEGYPNLEWFVFNDAPLEIVPGNLFSSNPKMRLIFFNFNKIKKVGENLLDNLTKLEDVRFLNNSCINQRASGVSEIPALIQAFKETCPTVEPTTLETSTEFPTIPITSTEPTNPSSAVTTENELPTELTTDKPSDSTLSSQEDTTTVQPPSKCQIENLEDFICDLDRDVENIREHFYSQIDNFNQENEKFSNVVQDLKEQNKEMRTDLKDGQLRILKMKEQLEEIITLTLKFIS